MKFPKWLKYEKSKIDYSTLVSDRDHHGRKRASVGKIALWLVLLPAIYFWIGTKEDIKPSHTQSLYALLVYNVARKSKYLVGPGSVESPLGPDEENDNSDNSNNDSNTTTDDNDTSSNTDEDVDKDVDDDINKIPAKFRHEGEE